MLILMFVFIGWVFCAFVSCFLSCLLVYVAKGSGDWLVFRFSRVSPLMFVGSWVPRCILVPVKPKASSEAVDQNMKLSGGGAIVLIVVAVSGSL